MHDKYIYLDIIDLDIVVIVDRNTFCKCKDIL